MHSAPSLWTRRFRGLPLVVLGLICGCGTDAGTATRTPSAGGVRPIQIIATVGMVADLVRQVGGDRVAVKQLCGSGVDPHLYKATRDDVQAIISADMVFHCGLMLEGKLADTLAKTGESKPVLAVAERLDESFLLEPEDFAGHFDPHVWMDVSAWSECVDVIADALAEFDPTGAAEYRDRATAYRGKLEELHAYGRNVIATIPIESRVLVTSHDAFKYFGRAYGLEVAGVQGLSTESESGLQRINELVDLLVARKVQAVFVESSVPRKNIEALVEGARARGHEVRIGGELYSDAMGPEGTVTGTYLGMLAHNLTLVARELGGTVPEAGFPGTATTAPAAGRE